MKLFVAVILCILVAISVWVNRYEIQPWLTVDWNSPVRKTPPSKVVTQYIDPRPLTEAEYQEFGVPAVNAPWGLAQLTEHKLALGRIWKQDPAALPSSGSPFGKEVFRRIVEMTDRLPSADLDSQLEFYNKFRGLIGIYVEGAEREIRYDNELALLWALFGHSSEVIETRAEKEGQSLYSFGVNYKFKNGKTVSSDVKTDWNPDLRSNFSSAIDEAKNREFYRREARFILLNRLSLSLSSIGVRRFGYIKRLEKVRDSEPEPDLAELCERMIDQLSRPMIAPGPSRLDQPRRSQFQKPNRFNR